MAPCLLRASLPGVAPAQRSRARFLSIATGGTGGVYYPYGGGLAKVLNEHLPGVRATAEVTAASVDNLKLIRDGRADIAFTLADTLADAVAGRGAFDGRPVASGEPRRALLELHASRHDRTSLESRPIAALRGKTVSTGSPGSGTEVIALRRAARRRARSGSRRDAAGPRRVRVGGCAQGRQDRRLLLERRPADRGRAGPGPHARACRCACCRAASCSTRCAATTATSTSRVDIPAGAYRGVDRRRARRRRRQRPRRQPVDAGRSRVRHHARSSSRSRPSLRRSIPRRRISSLGRAATGSPAEYHAGALRYYRAEGVPEERCDEHPHRLGRLLPAS